MKKFKNKLYITGSDSLLKAFAEELDKLGYIDWDLGLKLAAETIIPKEEIKIKIGKWYSSSKMPNLLVFCTEIPEKGIIGYGIDNSYNWIPDGTLWMSSSNFPKEVVEVNIKEVERRLVEYAKNHYSIDDYIIGANSDSVMLNLNAGKRVKLTGCNQNIKPYAQSYRNTIAIYTTPNVYLYADGIWAKKVQEVKVNGYFIEKIDVKSVKIGCRIFNIDYLLEIIRFLELYGGEYTAFDNSKWSAILIQRIIDEFNKM